MSTEIVTQKPKELSEVQMKEIGTYLNSLGGNLTNVQTTQFITLCREFQLNPFKREIYGIAYGKNFNIIVGYEVYIARAEGTGKLDGWERGTRGSGADMVAWIKIHRKDWKQPFFHEVDYSEYVQRNYEGKVNQMWATKPKTMLMKVVTAQAFRLAFPTDFAGMPYTSDEMPTGGDTAGIVKPQTLPEIDKIDATPAPKFTEPTPTVNVKEFKDAVNAAEEFIKQNGGQVEPQGIAMAPEPVKNQVDPADAKRANFWRMMCEMHGPDAPLELEKMTTFKGSKGDMVPGKTDINKISPKQLNYKFRSVESAYKKWKEAGGIPKNAPAPLPELEGSDEPDFLDNIPLQSDSDQPR